MPFNLIQAKWPPFLRKLYSEHFVVFVLVNKCEYVNIKSRIILVFSIEIWAFLYFNLQFVFCLTIIVDCLKLRSEM